MTHIQQYQKDMAAIVEAAQARYKEKLAEHQNERTADRLAYMTAVRKAESIGYAPDVAEEMANDALKQITR